MIHAAGILYVTDDNEVLFLKRSLVGDHAGEWCFPGGKVEEGEGCEEAALRESNEEIGYTPKAAKDIRLWTRTVSHEGVSAPSSPDVVAPQPVDYTTFACRVKTRFDVILNDEHVAFTWAPADQPPEPLHPGCRVALDRMTMDELGIAQAMRDGRLASPQCYENMWLFAIRITGTGTAYRKSIDEFVHRRPENYLTSEFLQRCQGLSVIWVHPPKAVMDSKEFAKRIVGSVMLPYIADRDGCSTGPELDEVWGIAKIYDEAAAKEMREKPLSTSPTVYFKDLSVNDKMTLEDGSTLLIEGKPSLLDHVAICEVGVWDKGGEPRGVAAITSGESSMTPEEKARADAEAADKARADAQAEEAKWHRLFGGIDTLGHRLSTIEARQDSFEEKFKKDENEDEEEAKKKKAAADKSKKDEDEDDEEAKKKKAAEAKAKEDSDAKAKKDAEEAEAKAKKDTEDDKDEDAKKKADALRKSIADDVEARIAKVQRMIPASVSDADYRALGGAQAKADAVYSAFGDSAPRPMQGEDLGSYRRRLVGGLVKHSKRWAKADVGAFADDVTFGVIEEQVFADAMATAMNPADVPAGQLRMHISRDVTGRQVRTFSGSPSAWMGPMMARRSAVQAFNRNPNHKGN